MYLPSANVSVAQARADPVAVTGSSSATVLWFLELALAQSDSAEHCSYTIINRATQGDSAANAVIFRLLLVWLLLNALFMCVHLCCTHARTLCHQRHLASDSSLLLISLSVSVNPT